MIRIGKVFLCSTSIQHVSGTVTVSKDYRKIEADEKQLLEEEAKRKEYEKYPLRYRLLECKPGLPLALTKLKYLLACRRTHPDAGGDAEAFLRVSLAYQDVMKDYGVETVENKVVNLGNFQVDDHEARNYLEARAQIKSFIPISTLEDHIRQIEEVRARLGDHLADRIAANDDEAMLLLEDIEEIMEENGLRTIRLEILEDGTAQVEKVSLTDGTEKPLYLESNTSPVGKQRSRGDIPSDKTTTEGEKEKKLNENDDSNTNLGKDATSSQNTLRTAEVSADDIEVLTAKNKVQDRTDVAGLASRTATEVMRNTEEAKQIRRESSVLFVYVLCIFLLFYVYIEGLMRAKSQQKKRPEVMEHVTTDTMLPWWGNDVEYESQVKRIFVEEWRRARASSRRVQTFQDGVARESLDERDKREMDLKIFTVTAERLREMRERVEKHNGRQ
ncbi:uncharacterized protein TM35_000431880 [Trypanosoma theileri]|uniref:J domain-containing protein n=1 Tax=Trypanosoma theileri TaxID=67003 RepID=A0A1X0NKJ2_9TRYP|nr:uncharacterized protein TM35_000431880 [Trypanosoma theileri]ORC84620.1 hypothetical protein TM35_000431880 [Trypanosoma theileri]